MRLSILLTSIIFTSLSLTACGGSDETTTEPTVQSTKASNEGGANKINDFKVVDGISMNINGSGASFPALIYGKWSEEYNTLFDGNINYDAIGSSNGIEQISNNNVDFGASDIPLTTSELKEKGLIQFPTVIGGVTPIINVEGIEAGQMVLDAGTLAKIYQGKITKWNDSAIVQLNPELALPDTNITTIHRSDKSGTTYNFTDYLSKAYPNWGTASKKLIPLNNSIGSKKTQEMASTVEDTTNSIGYIDFSYAKHHDLVYTSMINSSGNIVKPSNTSFSAAGDIHWEEVPGFYKLITNSQNPNAWPIATTTFILVNKTPEHPQQVAGVLSFFNWAYMDGYQSALDLDFVPFSHKPVAIFFKEWDKIIDKDGNPVYKVDSTI